MRNLFLSKPADNFVVGLDAKQFKQVFIKMLHLKKDVMPNDSAQIKSKDGKKRYRVDIGEYRIIYRFDETTVYVERIGKRNDDEVYRGL